MLGTIGRSTSIVSVSQEREDLGNSCGMRPSNPHWHMDNIIAPCFVEIGYASPMAVSCISSMLWFVDVLSQDSPP